jgi:hypothetical protein
MFVSCWLFDLLLDPEAGRSMNFYGISRCCIPEDIIFVASDSLEGT